MKLGATVDLNIAVQLGLRAAHMNLAGDLSTEQLLAMREEYAQAGVIGAQFGWYVNLASTDEAIRQQNIKEVRSCLQKAHVAGCRTIVVGGGHRDPSQPSAVFAAHADNWAPSAIDVLADSCAQVLDGLDIGDTKLAIETWTMTPLDSPKNVRRLLDKVNHPNLGILLDPVNMMNLDRYFTNGAFMQECVDVFGDGIVLVHLKDTKLLPQAFTYHMAEAPLGEGNLDLAALLKALTVLPEDLPVLVEHLKTPEAYKMCTDHARRVAAEAGISF